MDPTVSVLLPYRNAAETLDEALASTLATHEVALELLCIDDGSTDGGGAIVQRHAAHDPRVVPLRVPEGEGGGIVPALTYGLVRARGAFIARMDGDDVSLPGRFERPLAMLRDHSPIAVVGTCAEAFPADAVGEGLERYVAWQNGVITPEDHAREIFVESPLCHPSVTLRRDALVHVGAWQDTAWAEDYDLWMRFHAAGHQLAKVPEVLFKWRHRAGRATFTDPRYSPERMRELKAHYLAPRLARETRELVVWGAGPDARRLVRALEAHGVRPAFFVDIDPRKIGGVRRGRPVREPSVLDPARHFVVPAVGARGARVLIRDALVRAGFVELRDFLCVT